MLEGSMPEEELAKVKKDRAKTVNLANESTINYNEPVHHWFCCYLFYRRKQLNGKNALTRITHIEDIEAETIKNPAQEAKAHKFAQILYFQDDVAAEKRKFETSRKALELEQQEIPLEYRLYDRGKPASINFTERVLRQESRIGLLTSFEKYGK